MNYKIKKFAVLSHVLPPAASGQAIVLYRLLEKINKNNYCLISRKVYGQHNHKNKFIKKLPANYYYLKLKAHTGDKNRYKSFEYLKIPADIVNRTKQIEKIIEKENVKLLVVCSGDYADMLSSYFAAKNSKIKLILYMFDWFGYQWTGLFKIISKKTEFFILKKPNEVIVPNEFLAREIDKKYHKKSTIIRNPCELPDFAKLDKKQKVFDNKYINIVYTGAIYRAHYDAFHNLVKALRLIKNNKIKLHIYTAQPKEELKNEGIVSNSIILHPHVKHLEIASIQRQADILFLPLAFNSPFPEVINTSAPGKMGEYLSVSKPILAHVPSKSFVKWYIQKNNCGIVCDRLDPKLLAKEIVALIKNKKLQNKISKNSRNCAEIDFDVKKVREKFIKLIESLGEK